MYAYEILRMKYFTYVDLHTVYLEKISTCKTGWLNLIREVIPGHDSELSETDMLGLQHLWSVFECACVFEYMCTQNHT